MYKRQVLLTDVVIKYGFVQNLSTPYSDGVYMPVFLVCNLHKRDRAATVSGSSDRRIFEY